MKQFEVASVYTAGSQTLHCSNFRGLFSFSYRILFRKQHFRGKVRKKATKSEIQSCPSKNACSFCPSLASSTYGVVLKPNQPGVVRQHYYLLLFFHGWSSLSYAKEWRLLSLAFRGQWCILIDHYFPVKCTVQSI